MNLRFESVVVKSAITLAFLTLAAETQLCANEQPAAPRYTFRDGTDVVQWRRELRKELSDVLALPPRPYVPLQAKLSDHSATETYTMQRLTFTSEPGEVVPGYVLLPNGIRPDGGWPVMICLQGHAPGMHISIGKARNEKEKRLIAGGRDLALQAVRYGWAAVVIEQRAFGERATDGVSCQHRSMQDLMRGRPLTGQRVLDVVRAVDFIETQPDFNAQRIGCIGNSTGGTVSFYAACVEPRLWMAVVSCSFGTYEATWLDTPHCGCGYLPGILKLADMSDLAGLVSPRHLLLVAGKKDYLAQFEGVEAGYAVAKNIFAAAGHGERVTLIAEDGGHQFFPDQTWPVIQQRLSNSMRSSDE